MYFESLGHPTNIGLQLGKVLLSVQQVRVEGGMSFISFVSSLSFIFIFLPCLSLSSP